MGELNDSVPSTIEVVSPATAGDDGVSGETEEPVGPWLTLLVLLSSRGAPSNGPWDADAAGAAGRLERRGPEELLNVFEDFRLSGRDLVCAAVRPEETTPVEAFQLPGTDSMEAAVGVEGLLVLREEFQLPGAAVPDAQLLSLVPVALTERDPAEKTPVADGIGGGNGLVPGAVPVPNPSYSLDTLAQGFDRDDEDEADCAEERETDAAPVVKAGPVAWLP